MSFQDEYMFIAKLLSEAPVVDVGEWQAIRGDIPQARTIEVEDVSLYFDIPDSIEDLQEEVHPNLPWAEEHFVERVSGMPLNPPPSHIRWPFAQQGNDVHLSEHQFSHTYPERIWPKFAGEDSFYSKFGIRYPYGDLNDVIDLLRKSPHTRQAYLPIWFPEDTGAVSGQRVPCTLGYHFLVRDGKLKIVYYIRSCDFFRHFNDDVYMAARLAQFVAGQLQDVVAGKFVMHISSMHVFEPERERLVNLVRDYSPVEG